MSDPEKPPFGSSPPTGADLKAHLASAPLEGVDLERSRDMGRDLTHLFEDDDTLTPSPA